jgi:ParB family chromosome partitioning protein
MKKVLGKGLSALIPDSYVNKIKNQEEKIDPMNTQVSSGDSGFKIIPINQIIPNTEQPRKEFSADGIDELAASIREKGVLQPVIVKKNGSDQYMLVCGERRLRAATLCGLESIPAVIKDIAQDELLEWALIENIQREDLNPIEEAEAYRKLSEERMLSQEDIAKRVGKDRSTVTNAIRLLRLPPEIQNYLANGFLSAGHGRALLGLLTPEHQRQLAKRILEENLSVRQVEQIVNRSNAHKRKAKSARHLRPEIVDLETRLSQHFGTQVKVFSRKNHQQGRIEIQYFSLDDLDRILEKISLPNPG